MFGEMERLKEILSQYINSLSSDYKISEKSGNSTAELSYRPALDTFLVQLSLYINKNTDRVFEPRNQGAYGRPNWLFSNKSTMGIYGYVEAKGFDPNIPLNPKDYEKQVQRYLYLGNPVILTDGVDFILYKADGTSKIVSICKKPIDWSNLEFNTDILVLFREFFEEEGFRTISEKQLVTELSNRARHLCLELEEILSLEEDEAENEIERNTMVSLKQLWDIAATSHDKSLKDNHTFAGFVAQILAFGLLYAHRFVNSKELTPKEKYNLLEAFWVSKKYSDNANRLSPFKALTEALSEELYSNFSKLGIWYDNTRRMLSCVRLSDRQLLTPNFHELYEAFLKEYDGKTRNDFGAWYTPMSLADYTAKLVHTVLPSVIFGEPIKRQGT